MPRTTTAQQPHDDPSQIEETSTPPADPQSPHPDQLDLLDLLEGVPQ